MFFFETRCRTNSAVTYDAGLHLNNAEYNDNENQTIIKQNEHKSSYTLAVMLQHVRMKW